MAGVTRKISTELTIEGEADFKREMGEATRQLQNLSGEMKLSEAQFKGEANSLEALSEKRDILTRMIEQQEEKVRALNQAVEKSPGLYGEAARQTDNYRRQLSDAETALVNMRRELDKTDGYIDEAKRSADKAADSIDEFGREIKDVEAPSGLKDIASSFGGLGGLLTGGAIVGGIGAVKGAIDQVVDGSEEYRRIMGTLEVSSQAAGYSSEETSETFKQLYSVLGDTQSAATATANLQALGLSQEELTQMTDGAIGAWALYGDSIPIDSLAESINETVKAGEVTGTFADVLNWAGTSEDDFNKKLSEAKTQQEKVKIVMDELTKQGLPDNAQAWRDVNEDITDANEADLAFQEEMGKLGEVLSPAKDWFTGLATDGIKVVTGAIQGVMDIWDKFKQKLKEWGIADAFKSVQDQTLSESMNEAASIGTGSTTQSYAGIGDPYAADAASYYATQGTTVVKTDVSIDGEVVAQKMSSHDARVQRMRGNNMIDN